MPSRINVASFMNSMRDATRVIRSVISFVVSHTLPYVQDKISVASLFVIRLQNVSK